MSIPTMHFHDHDGKPTIRILDDLPPIPTEAASERLAELRRESINRQGLTLSVTFIEKVMRRLERVPSTAVVVEVAS